MIMHSYCRLVPVHTVVVVDGDSGDGELGTVVMVGWGQWG